MDLKKFEELIVIAKRNNVSSFKYDGITVHIEKEFPDVPDYDSHEPDTEPPEPASSSDYLLTNPTMG